ncbi:MAG TPA: response regulator [Acetobacteraceae bacterium]|nr:response regulator [Acetobacteraceae bacterium]
MPAIAPTETMSAASATVLLVDDEPDLRDVMTDFLELSGYHVVAAGTADEAIAVLDNAPVDVVFTDVRMPGGMDGIGLARWIHCHRPEIPVLITSGYIPRAQNVGAVSSGPLIAKPYRPEEIVRRVRELTGH